MPVKGIGQVKRKFALVVKDISEQKTDAAVYAVLSQGAAMAQTMTPIDTSNLVNSQYAPQIQNDGAKTTGNVGYTAVYAERVHEAEGVLAGKPRQSGSGNYWDPNAEPEFLRKGFEEIASSVPAILKRIYDV